MDLSRSRTFGVKVRRQESRAGSNFLFSTICRESHLLLPHVSFSFIRTAKRKTKERTVAASRPRHFATSKAYIAQPPDKYKSDQRPRLRDFPASICSFKHCERRRSTASYVGESRPLLPSRRASSRRPVRIDDTGNNPQVPLTYFP